MKRLPARWFVVGLAVVVTALLGIHLWQSAPPRSITLATGQAGGMYDTYGREYQRQLRGLGLRVEIVGSRGSVDNLERLVGGHVDVAFAQAGTSAIVANAGGVVRGVAALYVEPLWIFTRGETRVAGIAGLAGRTVAIGPVASGTEAVARALLERHGVAQDARLVNLAWPEARQQLEDGRLDAAFVVSSYRDSGIQQLLRRPGVRLMNVRHPEAYTRTFPFLAAVRVPEGLFDLAHNVPAEDVTLLAPVALLVCRESLHPRVVEMLLSVLRVVHGPGDLMNAPGRFPSREGVDVPLHATAEHDLRSGASWLSSILPYWALRWAFLVPLVAVWLPIMRVLPEIDGWRETRVMTRCYRKLRAAEAMILESDGREGVQRGIAACEALRREVEGWAQKLPIRRQRSIYQWRHHLSLVLDDARARLRELEADA